jgi:hypothetical protein
MLLKERNMDVKCDICLPEATFVHKIYPKHIQVDKSEEKICVRLWKIFKIYIADRKA